MLENEGYKKHLMAHLEKMGYGVIENYNPYENSILMLKNRNDQFIGNIDINSNANLYSAFAGEQDKTQKTIAFSEMFHKHDYNAQGSVNIMGHNNANLCAKLDEQTGDTYYLVLPDNPTNEELENPITYQNIDNAKRTFAVESGLMDNLYHSVDYQQALKSKLVDLLEKHGYEVQFGLTPSQATTLSLDDDMVATLDDNFALNVTTGNPKIRENLESIYEQAQWETTNEFEYYPTLMRRIADALIRLGYNVKHTFENLGIKLDIFKNGKVGELDNSGNFTPEKDTPASIRAEVESVYSSELEKMKNQITQMQEQLTEKIVAEQAVEFDTFSAEHSDGEYAAEKNGTLEKTKTDIQRQIVEYIKFYLPEQSIEDVTNATGALLAKNDWQGLENYLNDVIVEIPLDKLARLSFPDSEGDFFNIIDNIRENNPIIQAKLTEELAQEEMMYQMHEDLERSSIERTECEGISQFEQEQQNSRNPAHEDFRDTGETSSQLSRQEAVLIATLLKSDGCKDLTEKFNCRHAVDTLIKKIGDQYPDMPLATNELPTHEEMEQDEIEEGLEQ